ncbi:MAG: DNA polymerase III subunit alpha [Rikenellaceae bacterium]
MQNFVHLHVHSQYSILDGQASLSNLISKAMDDGMPAIALTDHGAMFGVKDFIGTLAKKKKGIKGDIEKLKKELSQCENEKREGIESQIEKLQEKLKFKPIIGCEVYVSRRGSKSLRDGKQDQSGYHLILLAKNQKGYKNLIKIVSRAWVDGFYMRPRTDRADIELFSEGLICTSACLGGEIPKMIQNDNLDGADEAIEWAKGVFGEDYYLEMQLHKASIERANHEVYPIQVKVNEEIKKLAKRHNVKLIATNDIHFVNEEDAEAHDRLICLSTGKDLDDPKRMLYTKQEWLKSRAEMSALFSDTPEAIDNTLEIASKIETFSIDNPPIMPEFDIPVEFGTEEDYRNQYSHEDLYNEFTRNERGEEVVSKKDGEDKIKQLGGYDKLYRIKLEADYLGKIAYQGAEKRYPMPLTEDVRERLDFELYIMKTMGFPGYFLIVQDFIRVAREELDVSVGPGRGSAAGSAVAYCLGITNIDPIKYDLLFERFLNPDRISLPDIDVDFDDDGRGRVLQWVKQKYGNEKVAAIITYGTMATKLSIKDVARVQKLPLQESDRLCKLIPDRLPDGKKMNLPNAIAAIPELKQAEESEDKLLSSTIRYAKMLEGNVRGTGVHACGMIICRDDITDWVPVSTADDKESGEKILVTQYEGSVIEDTGLIKMDFLGLKTLSIIKDAVANIEQSKGVKIDIERIPIDDELTYKLYSDGRTVGTFQFESAGMQKYLRELQPSVFEDLIAMNALYRPGPMDYIPDFVNRKHGRSEIKYDIPIMEKYLSDTYGITVYQEQVMLLSRLLGGFTRGESDSLRKAMGKKLRDKLDDLKPKFISGGVANGHEPEILDKIWGDWEKFASYAFNKSHATCYSWIAYQTAYLKANYPSEYMAALLSRNINDIKTLSLYMSECNRMGIKVLNPDVNESLHNFTPNQQGDIRFGLTAIKGVGEAAVASIIAERQKNGKFQDIFDFFERVNYSVVNRKCLESTAQAGGFDSISGFERSIFFATDESGSTYLEALSKYGHLYSQDKQNSQQSLFGGGDAVQISKPKPTNIEQPASQLEILKRERDVIGLYLSAHPLDNYATLIARLCNIQLSDLNNLEPLEGRDFSVVGLVTSVQNLLNKSGRGWGRFSVEDYTGVRDFALFGKDYESFRHYLYQDYILFIRGRVQRHRFREGELEIKINSISQIADVRENIKELTLTLPVERVTNQFIEELNQTTSESKGATRLRLKFVDNQEQVSVAMFSKSRKVLFDEKLAGWLNSNNIEFTL